MKALVIREVGKYSIEEVLRPKPKPEEVLVRVEVSGFCRTDLKLLKNGHRDMLLPCIPGEEVVGTVVETGKNTHQIQIGDRVYIYPGRCCKTCKMCKKGAENLCQDMKIMGFHRPGGFAECVLAPASSIVKLPEGLSFEEAVFAEPLSCCLNALELSNLKAGESIGIWGAGPAGNLLKRAAIAIGANPTVIEPNPERRAFVGAIGDPSGLIFDVCIVAVSSKEAYRQALSCLSPRGRLVIFSGLLQNEQRLELNLNLIHYLEQTLVGAYGCSYRHALWALQWIQEGKIQVLDLITHRFSLEEIGKAIEVVEQQKGLKVLIYPNS